MKAENFKISIEAARVNAGLSQWETANKMKISAATLANWESGKSAPTFSQLKNFCDLTGTPIKFIYIPKRT